MSKGALPAIAILAVAACEAPAPDPPPADPPSDSEPAAPLHLGIPPHLIARARREAAGLYRLPPRLRAQTLAWRRRERGPTYAELRADPAAYAFRGASFEGRVGFVRSAGARLWILPLHTRREGGRWVDPLFVLSCVPPGLPVEGGAIARIDGFVAGARTIGRNTLPLIVAYFVERVGEEPEDAAPSPAPERPPPGPGGPEGRGPR